MSETTTGSAFDCVAAHDERLSRLPTTAPESTTGATHAFRNAWTDDLFDLMTLTPDTPKVTEDLDRLSTLLLASVGRLLADRGEPRPLRSSSSAAAC